jgi:hypothetical protein
MAQAMIVEEKLKYLKRDSRSIGIQTGVDNELYFYLTNK